MWASVRSKLPNKMYSSPIRFSPSAFIHTFKISTPTISTTSFIPLSTLSSNLCSRRRFILTTTTEHSYIPAQANLSTENAQNTLVIVESPAKATTIQKILPKHQYHVTSCIGHIREIPSSAKRIPAKYKSLDWARLGVDVENDFRPLYVLIAGKQQVIRELKSLLKQSKELILATDDDREGEAISWHLSEVLKPTVPVKRAVFQEITPEAIQRAFSNCRDINLNLVQAQETRRVLDRLAGYTMSPLLWKKIAAGLSAGRVQSVAMSIIVQRELERLCFRKASFTGCVGSFMNNETEISATLHGIDGVRLVRGSDFDDDTGELNSSAVENKLWKFDAVSMDKLISELRKDEAYIRSVEHRTTTRNPLSPLITSTLQQECGNKLGMGAGRTMKVAQKLYENGLITYMRTDNPNLSEQAIQSCRETIKNLFGEDLIWDGSGNSRNTKPKAAQAAHEAIRPAGSSFTLPSELKDVNEDEFAVYNIIFKRTLASQMVSAKINQTTIKIDVPLQESQSGSIAEFKANGNVIKEPGFLSVYHDDPSLSSTYLPQVSEGERLMLNSTAPTQHETKPPARFNDASLVKILEEKGVGRPSTYAGIIEKLILRGYVYRGRMLHEDKKVPPRALVPSLTAFAVEKLLSRHFPSFIDAEFTAKLEIALDEIAAGSKNRTRYLEEYYKSPNGLAESVKRTENEIDAKYYRRIFLPNMPDDMLDDMDKDDVLKKYKKSKSNKNKRPKSKKSNDESNSEDIDWLNTKILVSSYGPYVEQNGKVVASLPKSTLAEELSSNKLEMILQLSKDPELGVDPESGLPILLKTSRYGPYVQLGHDDSVPEGSKPKRCGLFPGMDVDTITVELAIKLLGLPRLLGTHPKTGLEIKAALGPYGPYIHHDGSFVSLQKDRYSVLDIQLSEAIEKIDTAEERKRLRQEKLAAKKMTEETVEKETTSTSKKVSTTKRRSKAKKPTSRKIAASQQKS